MLLTTVRSARQRAVRRAGFTLLEVLVVVAILVILASIATIATTRYLEDSKKNKAQLQATNIHKAVVAFMTNPANSEIQLDPGMEFLTLSGQGHGTAYLKNGVQDLVDPWNQRFQVREIQGGDGGTDYLIYTVCPNDQTPISQFGVGHNSRVN